MSRYFERAAVLGDSGYLTMNPGAAPAAGPMTFAIVFKLDAFSGDRDLAMARTAGGATVWAMNMSGGQIFWSAGAPGFRACDTILAETWYLLAVSKAAGVAQLRSHLCDLGADSWAHTDRGTIGDAAGPIDHLWLGRAFGAYQGGYTAAVGLFPAVLGDAAVEALRPGLRPWLDAGAAPLWRLNDTPVADLSGGSGNQQAIQGTTVNTAIEPPGFDYSLDEQPEPEPEPEPEDQPEGSWEQWLDAIRTGSQEYHYYKNRERDHPVECPNDGEPLQAGPGGTLYCPYDGWQHAGAGSSN